MKEFFGSNTGKHCSICGKTLKQKFYSNKPLCFTCWKNELRGRNSIKDIMARLGENSTAGRKHWAELKKQQEKQYKNYSNVETPAERVYAETARKIKFMEKYKVVD